MDINVIKHKYGADSAAVIFDAKKHAESKRIDVVLADTAGRTHVDKNLMEELKKLVRVNKPDFKILIIDSLVGNDAVPQARMFNEAVGVDAVMFTKIDVTNPSAFDQTDAFIFLAAMFIMIVSNIGAAITLTKGEPAAIGSITANREVFTPNLIYLGLGEALAIYGLIIGILLWTKIP